MRPQGLTRPRPRRPRHRPRRRSRPARGGLTSSGANDARTAGPRRGRPARPRRGPAGRRRSRTRGSASVPNIGGSSLLIVTGTPASTKAGSGCSARRATARVATLEDGHTSSGIRCSARWSSSARVLRRRRAVADALGAEHAERVPDRLRPGGLAGVRHAVQPRGPGRVEVRLELRARHADLGTAEPEADQPVGRVVERVAEGRVGAGQPGSPGMS